MKFFHQQYTIVYKQDVSDVPSTLQTSVLSKLSSSSEIPPKTDPIRPTVSSASSSQSQQTSLRVFRNLGSKQQSTHQHLRNNNSIQRSSARSSPTPSPPETSFQEDESESTRNNSPLDFTSKKVRFIIKQNISKIMYIIFQNSSISS